MLFPWISSKNADFFPWISSYFVFVRLKQKGLKMYYKICRGEY